MTTVYWNYISNDKEWFSLTKIAPAPALAEIIKNRDASSLGHFTRCPAFQEYYKNTYVIKSPIDIEIIYDKATNRLNIFPQNQEFYDSNIIHRAHAIGENDDFLMGFGLSYLFIADKDCMLEWVSASMHKSDFIDKTRLIEGTFNINRWYRPTELAFELKDPNTSIKIKRGDPIAYVRFIPKDGDKIKLEETDFSEDTLKKVKHCLTVKDSSNKLPLKTLYELAERMRSTLWFNKKKCPFNWRNK